MLKELIAKTVKTGKYWIITDGERKVGNITANSSGYGVCLNNSVYQFNTTKDIKDYAKIRFEPVKTNKTKINVPYPQYPVPERIYNSILDVSRGLHLFTKKNKSKCYYAAGWFVIEYNGTKQIEYCPKYIFIERYPYIGPFKSKQEAESQINIV